MTLRWSKKAGPLKNHDERFDGVDGRLTKIDERLDRVDGRLTKIDERLDRVDGRLTKVDERLNSMDYTINTLKGTLKNSNATRGWSQVEPLGSFQTSDLSTMKYEMPPNLPDRVVKFWRLQKPREHHTLISLLRFYHVQGLETWKEDLRDVSDDETDSDGSFPSTPSLEDVVAENPLLALSALAEVLGVNFKSIKLNIEILVTLDAINMLLDNDVPTPSQYNSIKHFDVQFHSVLPEILRGIGKILVKHAMNLNFCASLLHRHGYLCADSLMVHSNPGPYTDICKVKRLEKDSLPRGLSPCSFYLIIAQRFQGFEYHENGDNIMPELGFLEDLRAFLTSNQSQDVVALSRMSPGQHKWVECLLSDEMDTIARRCLHDGDQVWVAPGGVVTEWAFIELNEGIEYKAMRKCIEPPEGGGHVEIYPL